MTKLQITKDFIIKTIIPILFAIFLYSMFINICTDSAGTVDYIFRIIRRMQKHVGSHRHPTILKQISDFVDRTFLLVPTSCSIQPKHALASKWAKMYGHRFHQVPTFP